MRRIHAPASRLSALTAPLTSPFFRPIEPSESSESSVQSVKGPASQNPGTISPKSNREFSDAAIRTSRSLW